MANITQSLANTAGFIPQAWANEALDVLRNNIALAKLVSKDTDYTDGAWKGKSLTVAYPGTFTAQAKAPGSVATVQTPTGGASQTINLTTHNTVDFVLEDVGFTESVGMTMAESYGSAAGIALAEQMESDLLAQYVNFTGGTVGTPGTDLTDAVLRQARKLLNDNKAPQQDRAAIISDKDEISLMGDSSLATYFAFSQANTIKNGPIGTLHGLDIYTEQLTPTSAGGSGYQQSATITGSPTGGTFTLTFNGQTTGAIAYNASAAAVQAALVALSSIGAGNVQVSGAAGGPYTITFVGTLGSNTTAMTASGASLTGGTTPSVTIANTAALGTKDIAFHKNAILLANRPLQSVATAGVEVAYATDSMTGLTMRVQMQYDIKNRGIYVAYDILYGILTIRPSLGIVLLS